MGSQAGRARHAESVRRFFAGSALALLLAGCQTASSPAPTHTGSIGTSTTVTPSDLSPEQALGAIQKWGSAYGRDEKDKTAALNYAAALRAAGETKQGVAVMRKAAIYHATDREVLAALGKALAADGRFEEALGTVRRAQRSDNPDWQLLATEGGILDSVGKHDDARALYRQALVLAPGEPQILNNLGLSYVLTNELELAEEALRQAVASPKATLKTRQNLALVLGLRGKSQEGGEGQEGGQVSGAAAAPTADEALVQQNTWAEIAQSG